jgi:hypothetical protein
MPSVTPLNNIKLQSSLNLNNQLLLNTNRAKAYTLKNLGATNKTLDVSDIGCLLLFNGNRYITINASITGVSAGDSFFAVDEIGILIPLGGGVTLIDSGDYSANSDFNVLQFIYLGSNIWLKINTN